MISVITPTYNRAELLPQIFASLKRQTCKDFEWIIVDDGSFDGTECVVKEMDKERGFPVHYIKKENGGKHTAVNLGVKKAKGELTLILDSDDELPKNAVEAIQTYLPLHTVADGSKSKIQNDKSIGGLCFYMAHQNGEVIGKPMIETTTDEVALRYNHHVAGDMCEVFRTDVLREFPFPEIPGERFCPEQLVWFRIAQKYQLKVIPQVIYLRDYLDGGLTDNIVKIRMNSPVASMMTYAEMLDYDIPLKEKVKAAINYWRFRLCKPRQYTSFPILRGAYNLLMPLGWLMHRRDARKVV